MRRIVVALAILAGALGAIGREATPLAEDPRVEARLIAIAEELRCLVCQNESLSASRAELAQDLRRELRTLIRQGRTDAEIRDFMVSRYGDFVLYRPPVKRTTWLLWFGPFVLLAAGGVIWWLIARRRGRKRDDDEATPAEDGIDASVEKARELLDRPEV